MAAAAPTSYGATFQVAPTMLNLMPEAVAEYAWAQSLGKALRDALGDRTQKWLAEAMDVDPTTVSRFILGKQIPTLEQLSRAAMVLGVSTRSLLTRAGYIDDDGLVDPDLLPPGGRRAVRAILREFAGGVESDGAHGANGVS